MSVTLNKYVLNLLEATLTLYPADPTGAPVLGYPIWTGAPAEKLTVRERWTVKQTTPTGARYKRNHPLIPEYEISIGRVWLLDKVAAEWATDWRRYVLDVTWRDEETGAWHRRVYYGLTVSDRDIADRDIEAGFTDDQTFAAEYYTTDSGGGIPPVISPTLPYTVQYTGSDGVPVLLYVYDATTHVFTAQATTTGRAVINGNGSAFTVQFDGDPTFALQAMNNPAMNYRTSLNYRKTALYRGGAIGLMARSFQGHSSPSPVALPRLDFFYGPTRVATLTQTGLYDVAFTQGTPVTGTGRFALYASSQLVATLGAGEVKAQEFIVA